MYSYNGVEFPALPVVDENLYPFAVISQSKLTDVYHLRFLSSDSYYFTKSNVRYFGGDKDTGNLVSGYYCSYDNSTQAWEELIYSDNQNVVIGSSSVASLVWVNFDATNADGSVYMAASVPIPVGVEMGILSIQSSQILDDSASFVVAASDLTSSDLVYNIKWILSSGGEEVASNITESFSSSDYGLHLTVPDLDPETEYEIEFILRKDGVDTSVTASTSFTTLAGSGVPDYSGQLEDIQQGVDNVGTKLDGVQETLTETKEEITSLPEKIATSIIEGVKGLFIPSPEDLNELLLEYELMLEKELGFIWQSLSLVVEFVGNLSTAMESGESYEFTFPGVKVPINGEEFVFIAETSVSLENELMDVLRPVLGTIVSIVCVTAFVNMSHDYLLAIISGISVYQFERRRD